MYSEQEILEAREALAAHISDATRLKWTLKKLGEQESYIQELEHTISEYKKREDAYLNGNDKIKTQIKQSHIYQQQKGVINSLNKTLATLRKDYEYLLIKLNARA